MRACRQALRRRAGAGRCWQRFGGPDSGGTGRQHRPPSPPAGSPPFPPLPLSPPTPFLSPSSLPPLPCPHRRWGSCSEPRPPHPASESTRARAASAASPCCLRVDTRRLGHSRSELLATLPDPRSLHLSPSLPPSLPLSLFSRSNPSRCRCRRSSGAATPAPALCRCSLLAPLIFASPCTPPSPPRYTVTHWRLLGRGPGSRRWRTRGQFHAVRACVHRVAPAASPASPLQSTP